MFDFIKKLFGGEEEKHTDLKEELKKNEKALEELQKFNEEMFNKNFKMLSK